jgi:hypothetical protein
MKIMIALTLPGYMLSFGVTGTAADSWRGMLCCSYPGDGDHPGPYRSLSWAGPW